MHFAGKSFSQVCKNYPHLARSKRRTQFLWVLITSRGADPDLWAGSPRVGNIVTIYHRRRDLHPHKSATEIPTRTAFILLGRREPGLSINYHDPVVNKKQNIIHSPGSSPHSPLLSLGLLLYRLFCWIVFQYLQNIKIGFYTHMFSLFSHECCCIKSTLSLV